jgi:hypothetical protein
MHIFDYLIYQLRPYGMPADQRPSTPEPPPDLNLTASPWFAPPDEVTEQQIVSINTIPLNFVHLTIFDLLNMENIADPFSKTKMIEGVVK